MSGKGRGYHGCFNGARRACDNEVLIARTRLEDEFVAALNAKAVTPELLDQPASTTSSSASSAVAPRRPASTPSTYWLRTDIRIHCIGAGHPGSILAAPIVGVRQRRLRLLGLPARRARL